MTLFKVKNNTKREPGSKRMHFTSAFQKARSKTHSSNAAKCISSKNN